MLKIIRHIEAHTQRKLAEKAEAKAKAEREAAKAREAEAKAAKKREAEAKVAAERAAKAQIVAKRKAEAEAKARMTEAELIRAETIQISEHICADIKSRLAAGRFTLADSSRAILKTSFTGFYGYLLFADLDIAHLVASKLPAELGDLYAVKSINVKYNYEIPCQIADPLDCCCVNIVTGCIPCLICSACCIAKSVLPPWHVSVEIVRVKDTKA